MFGESELGLVRSPPDTLGNVPVVVVVVVVVLEEVPSAKTFPRRSSRLGLILLSRGGFARGSGLSLLYRFGANIVGFPNGLQLFVVRAEDILGISRAP